MLSKRAPQWSPVTNKRALFKCPVTENSPTKEPCYSKKSANAEPCFPQEEKWAMLRATYDSDFAGKFSYEDFLWGVYQVQWWSL
jgi:hypothetical protein